MLENLVEPGMFHFWAILFYNIISTHISRGMWKQSLSQPTANVFDKSGVHKVKHYYTEKDVFSRRVSIQFHITHLKAIKNTLL